MVSSTEGGGGGLTPSLAVIQDEKSLGRSDRPISRLDEL